jgi:enamine deaminase RidA (YjgF/YER057c/UK114 family)
MSNLTPEQKLAALGLTLPAVPTPLANYVPYRWAGNLLFLSGQGPKRPDGTFEIGRLGKNATIEDGYQAARLTGLQLLAVAKSAVGELSRIEAVVKLLGMVNAEADFGDHPKVINGCSDLLVETLGEAGRHARSAVGMGSLPNGIMVEIEAILLIRP